MFGSRAVALFGALLSIAGSVAAAPVAQSSSGPGSSTYWVSDIQRQGTVAFGDNSSYQIFRNVMDYGAKGDGSTDDTVAINNAISSGNRCGLGCNSSTTTPAIVYFPPGTYMVSTPINMYYYTQMIGDITDPPTIKATSGFLGLAVVDSDPYTNTGDNWWVNQNNFFRQVRNFVIDLTAMPSTSGACIHWQVAQATSLQNVVFNMIENSSQIGIFMDNGSGGFIGDLVFNGGNYGAFLGNQQFTSRNLTFNNCKTAIFMNWNWGWTLSQITINNCGVGIDMANDPTNQTVGSVILLDSVMTGTPVGINSSFVKGSGNVPATGGTLIIDNVDFGSATNAVQSSDGTAVLSGGGLVKSWAAGKGYTGASGTAVQGTQSAPSKPASLLSGTKIFARSKPQYENYPASSFVSAKSSGCKGDGVTDDTAAIQSFLNSVKSGQIAYFDHGAYLVSSTIKVPSNIMITGEIWPLIMATGKAFRSGANPTAVFQTSGTGAVELSDLIFETKGTAPGAVMIEWGLSSAQGDSGIWDTHVRIGGSAGTELQGSTCAANSAQTTANTACEGSFLMFHATSASSGVYLENTWFWTADHEMDEAPNPQVSIYNGRGMLIESGGPVWLYGTSAEHSILYNYQFNNVKALFAGFMQSETPYFQPDPTAPAPYTFDTAYTDPTFTVCNSSAPETCHEAWGLRVVGSSGVLIYGTGFYSFFQNYDQTCVAGENCQQNMIHIQHSEVSMYGVSTKASVNMIVEDGVGSVLDADNRDNFCATIAFYVQ